MTQHLEKMLFELSYALGLIFRESFILVIGCSLPYAQSVLNWNANEMFFFTTFTIYIQIELHFNPVSILPYCTVLKKCLPIPSGSVWIYSFVYHCMFLPHLRIFFSIIIKGFPFKRSNVNVSLSDIFFLQGCTSCSKKA